MVCRKLYAGEIENIIASTQAARRCRPNWRPGAEPHNVAAYFAAKINNNMDTAKKITAICFGDRVYKYHLRDKPADLCSFERFVARKGIKYVNYYDTSTKQYIRRQQINPGK